MRSRDERKYPYNYPEMIDNIFGKEDNTIEVCSRNIRSTNGLHPSTATARFTVDIVVQTLSRINRTHQGKTDTFIIDFQNSVDEITHAFEPFYKGTMLIDKTDPGHLFKLYQSILD